MSDSSCFVAALSEFFMLFIAPMVLLGTNLASIKFWTGFNVLIMLFLGPTMVLLLAMGAGVLGIIISVCGCFETELVIELPSFRIELGNKI